MPSGPRISFRASTSNVSAAETRASAAAFAEGNVRCAGFAGAAASTPAARRATPRAPARLPKNTLEGHGAHLLLPPPPRPPLRPPKLEAPRELLALALLPLKPPEPPPKPPPLSASDSRCGSRRRRRRRLLALAPPAVRAPCWLALCSAATSAAAWRSPGGSRRSRRGRCRRTCSPSPCRRTGRRRGAAELCCQLFRPPASAHVRVVVDLVEVVVDVDVDVVASAAPAAAAAGAAPDGRAHHDAEAERDERGPGRIRRVVDRRIRVDRRPVDDRRAVRRHVDDLGVRRLDDDDCLSLDDLRLDLLLLVRLQGPVVLGLLPHPLDGVHDVALLREEGVPEVGRPLDVVREPLHDLGKCRHRLDARVPGLLGDGVRERLVLQVRVLRHPLLELDDLERVGGGHERLGEERVGVEGDRCHERVELLRWELRGLLGCRRRGGRRLLRHERRVARHEQGATDDRKGPAKHQMPGMRAV